MTDSQSRRQQGIESINILAALQQTKSLASIAQEIASFRRASIRIAATLIDSENIVHVGINKFGGYPDLPPDVQWPVSKLMLPSWLAPSATGIPIDINGNFSLPFIAQLRMEDTKAYDLDGLLPSSGMLYFFYAGSQYGFDNGNSNYWRVFWCSNTNELKPVTPPTPLIPDATYHTCSLTFANEQTLPHVETCWIGRRGDSPAKLMLSHAQWDEYADFLYRARANQTIHQMLGHSDDVQPNALEYGYNLVQDQIFPDSKNFSSDRLQKQFQQSRLLLQIDVEANGMRFGRDGRLFFFIREDDLRRSDFSKVWAIEQ
ncbi:MAG TPA: YwqG family protein [Oculatellaceae cyanobacterium]